jgi:hypothetical protein
VNPPIGKGLPVPGPLRPLFAIPTTLGPAVRRRAWPCSSPERMHVKTESRASAQAHAWLSRSRAHEDAASGSHSIGGARCAVSRVEAYT